MNLRKLAIFGMTTAIAVSAGCTIAPKSFLQANDPAPLVRARALGLGRGLPDSQVIPQLIGQLNDADAVVRMTASEELKRRSGQDFGYKPWADPAERAPAVAKWQSWWAAQPGQSAGRTNSQVSPTHARRRLFRRW